MPLGRCSPSCRLSRCRCTRADEGEFAKQGFADRDFALGSKGVSSYESMKLGTALKDLDDATAAAASKAEVVKVLAYYRGVCGYVEGGGRLKPDAGIDDAGRALSELAAGQRSRRRRRARTAPQTRARPLRARSI